PGEVLTVSAPERAEAGAPVDAAAEGVDFLLPNARVIDLPPARVARSAANMWQVRFSMPDGYHANEAAPILHRFWVEGDGVAIEGAGETHRARAEDLPLLRTLKATNGEATAVLHLAANFPYCTDRGGLCLVQSVVLRQEVTVVDGGPDWLNWTIPIEA
ncbi:MAG: hypothetical protein KC466_08915, partial [Myxococcales bacterium]|nr:hypothetical protein [Myxococcales bacterium]